MEKSIKLKDREIKYTHKISKRSKNIRISIYPGGKVVVGAPRFVPGFILNKFLKEKSNWIIEKLDYLSKFKPSKTKKEQNKEFQKHKDKALQLALDRLNYFNKFYNFKWNHITIRNQKTRWGSCSKKGNINYNYKIALVNPDKADYVIVHELCHLKEFNHSKKFWNLVALTIPNYEKIIEGLNKEGLKLD